LFQPWAKLRRIALPSIATSRPSLAAASDAVRSTNARSNAAGPGRAKSRAGEEPGERADAGDAVGQLQERRQPRPVGPAVHDDLVPVVGAAHDGRDGDAEDVTEPVPHVVPPGVVESGERAQKDRGCLGVHAKLLC